MILQSYPAKNISIHALRGEGDDRLCVIDKVVSSFNPRPPWGGRPLSCDLPSTYQYISIHALRGEGDKVKYAIVGYLPKISIHALRGEGDKSIADEFFENNQFQSTPSVGRATFSAVDSFSAYKQFQSTPSVGRATNRIVITPCNRCNFNPRPPWGGRLLLKI